ncbi:1068_t:CDS:2, partial [Acaulospora morrowiae]
MSVKDVDLKNTINKFDTMLELIENLRGSFNNICDYLDETWKVSGLQENTSSLERKNGEKFGKFFDSDRFSIMNDA